MAILYQGSESIEKMNESRINVWLRLYSQLPYFEFCVLSVVLVVRDCNWQSKGATGSVVRGSKEPKPCDELYNLSKSLGCLCCCSS